MQLEGDFSAVAGGAVTQTISPDFRGTEHLKYEHEHSTLTHIVTEQLLSSEQEYRGRITKVQSCFLRKAGRNHGVV